MGGRHWSEKNTTKNWWRLLVRNALQINAMEPVRDEEYPVTVECRLTFGPGKRRYDWDNVAVTSKLIQDGLIKSGILKGDSPKYITGGRMWTVKGDTTHTLFIIRTGKHADKFD